MGSIIKITQFEVGIMSVIMEIYRNNKKIESKEFRGHFYILKDLTGHICWTSDDEKGGNEILIWIRSDYSVPFIRPDWQLIIDGIPLPKKFHTTVELSGKHVNFQYSDYEFVCHFPQVS